MKRIVNGVTYNTETSTALAKWEDENDDGPVTETLYQNRGGAFFVVAETAVEAWNERAREYEKRPKISFEPMSPEEAHKWMMNGEVEVIKNPFDDPPEATAEAEPGATIYIRVPASLKREVDEAARVAKVSGNVWAMRCVERCLKEVPDDIVRAWAIASTFRAHANDGQWTREAVIAAHTEVADFLEDYAEAEHGRDSMFNDYVGQDRFQVSVRKYQPYSETLPAPEPTKKRTASQRTPRSRSW